MLRWPHEFRHAPSKRTGAVAHSISDFPDTETPGGVAQSPDVKQNNAMIRIDFTSLAKAIASLDKAPQAAKLRPKDEFARDASIQRCEYTYALCV